MLEYSEYQDLTEILSRSDVNNVYEDLMKKESQVLNTVNSLVKHYKDSELKETMFYNKSILDFIASFFNELSFIVKDLPKISNVKDLKNMLMKDDRVLYVGFLLMIIAFFIMVSVN